MKKEICCPGCGHRDLQVTNEVDTKVSGKNYSAGNGCLGYLLFGPLGLLCGSCGQKQNVTTTNTQFWVCPKCGEKFRNPEDLRKEGEEKGKKAKGGVGIIAFFAAVILIILIFGMIMEPNWTMFFAGFILSFIILGLLSILPLSLQNQAKKQIEEAYEIERNMQRFSGSKNNYGDYTNQKIEYEESKPTMVTQGEYQNDNRNIYKRINDNNESEGWLCTCNVKNSSSVNFCPNCGNPKNNDKAQVNLSPNEWKCPSCGKVHQKYVGTCGCGTERP